MNPIAICVLAYCLIAEGHTRQCAPAHEEDALVKVEKPLDFALTADLGPGFTSIEHRACVRLANDLSPPINYRRVDLFVKHPSRTPAQSAAKERE
jgi:hypothetical protein